MTRGAIQLRQLKEDEAKRKSNERIEANKLADKEKQRAWESKENKKSRIKDYITGGLRAIKFGSKLNDPKWYKQYIPNLERFVNVPTYHRLGAEPFANNTNFFTSVYNNKGLKLPGIMVIYYMPSIGPQLTYVSSERPANQALNRDKEQILKSNSRSNVNWEGADFGLNTFCTADLIEMIAELKRVLLVYQTYRGDNAYLAKHFITAMGFDYDDVDNNIAEYRKAYTIIVHKFNSSIVAPADLSLYARKSFLVSNIFKDRSGDMKQVYIYKPMRYFRLNNAGDGAVVIDMNDTLLSTFIKAINFSINQIVGNPDYVEMYADLRSAITNLIQLDPDIPKDGVIEFNDDPLNRAQIHNLKTLPMFQDQAVLPNFTVANWALHIDTDGYLYQGDTSYINRSVEYSFSGYDSSKLDKIRDSLKWIYDAANGRKLALYDMDKDDVTGDDILDITRGNVASYGGITTVGTSGIKFTVYDCGTEVFSHFATFNMDTDGNIVAINMSTDILDGTSASEFISYQFIYSYSKFDWAPMCTWYALSPATYAIDQPLYAWIKNACLMSDLDHVFTIGQHDLSKINEACVLSELFLITSQFKS